MIRNYIIFLSTASLYGGIPGILTSNTSATSITNKKLSPILHTDNSGSNDSSSSTLRDKLNMSNIIPDYTPKSERNSEVVPSVDGGTNTGELEELYDKQSKFATDDVTVSRDNSVPDYKDVDENNDYDGYNDYYSNDIDTTRETGGDILKLVSAGSIKYNHQGIVGSLRSDDDSHSLPSASYKEEPEVENYPLFEVTSASGSNQLTEDNLRLREKYGFDIDEVSLSPESVSNFSVQSVASVISVTGTITNSSQYSIQNSSVVSSHSSPAKLQVRFFQKTHVKDWKILDLFRETLRTYKPISNDCILLFKRSFKYFASNYQSNDTRLKFAMQKLCDNCDKVLASNPAQLLLNEESIGVSFDFLHVLYFFLIFLELS